jgi:hypothetical protein
MVAKEIHMASSKRRSGYKPLLRAVTPSRRKKQVASLFQSPVLRTVVIVAGITGLAALGIALFGPRRFNEQVIRPIGAATVVPLAAAMAPQADRVWAETRPWRDRVANILASINTEEVRAALAERLSHWVERFR